MGVSSTHNYGQLQCSRHVHWIPQVQTQTIRVIIIAKTYMRQRLNTPYRPTRAFISCCSNRERIKCMLLLHIVLLTRILALWVITHPITRSSARAKYKHRNGPQLEVTFTRCRLTLTRNVTILIKTVIISQRAAPVRSQGCHMVLF